RVDLEVGQDVLTLAEVLDLVREPAAAPDVGLLDGATQALDQLVDRGDRRLQLLVVELRADDVQDFIIPEQGFISSLWDRAPANGTMGWPAGPERTAVFYCRRREACPRPPLGRRERTHRSDRRRAAASGRSCRSRSGARSR